MTKNFLCRFFRLCETFFATFSNVFKGPPSFFPILQNNGCPKTPKGPPSTFFGTMRLTGDQKNSKKKFQKKIGIFSQSFPQAGTVEENT